MGLKLTGGVSEAWLNHYEPKKITKVGYKTVGFSDLLREDVRFLYLVVDDDGKPHKIETVTIVKSNEDFKRYKLGLTGKTLKFAFNFV